MGVRDADRMPTTLLRSRLARALPLAMDAGITGPPNRGRPCPDTRAHRNPHLLRIPRCYRDPGPSEIISSTCVFFAAEQADPFHPRL